MVCYVLVARVVRALFQEVVIMTTHVVADDVLGKVTRRWWEVQRRLMEGTLDPDYVARNVQRIVRGAEVPVMTPTVPSPFFAGEEVKSVLEYPERYAVRPISVQLEVLSGYFPELDVDTALARSKKLPSLPQGAEGWFAVPREGILDSYDEHVVKVFECLKRNRLFFVMKHEGIDVKETRLTDRTIRALDIFGNAPGGDILLIPAQFGLRHRGRSVRRVRMMYAPNEFGLGAFMVGCMLLTHPNRLEQMAQLAIDCPGDECLTPNGEWTATTAFAFRASKVCFEYFWPHRAYSASASATGFIPV